MIEENKIYQHYKGGLYQVIGIASNSKGNKEKVIYRSCETNKLYHRSLESFTDKVLVNNNTESIERFKLIKNIKIKR